jgi:redox-sensing transcriptional repressor
MATRHAKAIPPKTLHRLILYRNVLARMKGKGKEVTFSGELALLCGNRSDQVRRDLMAIAPRARAMKGYRIEALHGALDARLKAGPAARVAMVGVGRMGSALAENLSRHKNEFLLRWVFDRDPRKIGSVFGGRPCIDIARLASCLEEDPVELGVIAIDGEQAQEICELLVGSGARAIINMSSQPVRVPRGVHLEVLNMSLIFQKLAFHLRAGN